MNAILISNLLSEIDDFSVYAFLFTMAIFFPFFIYVYIKDSIEWRKLNKEVNKALGKSKK